jgi:hypothetical protein
MLDKKRIDCSVLKEMINYDDVLQILEKMNFLIKTGFFFKLKSATIKIATLILLRGHCFLLKKGEIFWYIFGSLSLAIKINQEYSDDEELRRKTFFTVAQPFSIKSKIRFEKFLDKIFGFNSSIWCLKSKIQIFIILFNFTHEINAPKIYQLDCIHKSLVTFKNPKIFHVLKKKIEFFTKQYLFERKLIHFFLSLIFSEKFLWCFWIWIKIKSIQKNNSVQPWWRGLKIREADLEFYEQTHIYFLSYF